MAFLRPSSGRSPEFILVFRDLPHLANGHDPLAALIRLIVRRREAHLRLSTWRLSIRSSPRYPMNEYCLRTLLASVTEHCVIVRTNGLEAHLLLPLALSSMKKIQTSHPGFVAIAAALFLIAAAAQSSKEGGGAAIPAALFGVCSLLAYLVSRRSAVAFYRRQGTGRNSVRRTAAGRHSDFGDSGCLPKRRPLIIA